MTNHQDKEKRNLEYRNAGIALTVTVTAFSVGLLSWSTSQETTRISLHIFQLSACSITILVSLFAQLSLYQGYKYQARSLQEGYSYRKNNNRSLLWFKTLDWSADLSVFLLAVSFISSIVLWWPY
jgi:cobalamin biosynthesis protein CobD/CbiB